MLLLDTHQLDTLIGDLDSVSDAADRASAAQAAVLLHRYATALHQSGLLSDEHLSRCHAEIDRALGNRLMPDGRL